MRPQPVEADRRVMDFPQQTGICCVSAREEVGAGRRQRFNGSVGARQAGHAVTMGEQFLHNGRADEAGRASQEDLAIARRLLRRGAPDLDGDRRIEDRLRAQIDDPFRSYNLQTK